MEETGGPEAVKRPRLDPYSEHILSHQPQQPQQQQQPSTYPPHSTIPPPHLAYTPRPPPSPYEVTAADHRALLEPSPHPYAHPPASYAPQVRDPRNYPPDVTYSRHGSASAPTRSSDDVQQLAQPRPLLTTASSHEAHHYPQPQHPEHLGPAPGYMTHDGQPNGHAHGLPMSTYNESSRAPSQGHGGEYSQSPVHTTPHAYGGGPFGAPSNYPGIPRPKKQNRAIQACDVCRSRKQKCDEGRPECGFCVESSMRCNYQTVAPAKADRANQAILEQLASHKHEIKSVDKRLERIEKMLLNIASQHPSTHSAAESQDIKPVLGQMDRESSERKHTEKTRTTHSLPPPPAESLREGDEQKNAEKFARRIVNSEPARADDGSFSFSVEHTTAAHRLLRWPAIKALLKPWSHYSDDYVMEMEENKGVLRVYGKGRGRDYGDGGQPGPFSPSSNSPSVRGDELHEAQSPASPPEGLWGTSFNSPPATEFRNPTHESIGGLNPDGTLKIDPPTLHRLLASYMENIHIMHPFMDKARLARMVERFAKRYNPSEMNVVKSPFTLPAVTLAHDSRREPSIHFQKIAKRKHSDASFHSFNSELGSMSGRSVLKPALEHSISTAIVLLVMALGRICEHQTALPGPVPDDIKETPNQRPSSYSPMPLHTDSPPPLLIRQSPTSSSHSTTNTSAPSPMSGLRLGNLSRRSSTEEPCSGLRNVDVIPGLAYFARATDILGNLSGANDLAHVQANLLAGLFTGQLASVFESWSWIYNACRACRLLVRDPTLSKERDPIRKDLINFAFWTCSQLESDILAELDMPRTGISDITGVSYPKGYVEQAEIGSVHRSESKMMIYYSGQIQLRQILNGIQKDLYPPDTKDSERTGWSTTLRDRWEDWLQEWRAALPEPLQWNDSDDSSHDITEARLRAKFYGARYIIHRPFLRHAIVNKLYPDDARSSQADHSKGVEYNPSAFSAINSERRSSVMPPPRSTNISPVAKTEILHSARICVEAAISSTVAFDGILLHKRLIVTNIFGTAHAQFGNILVLAATYKSTLSSLVPLPTLEHLLNRTIKFLRSLCNISATLEQDVKILEAIKESVLTPTGEFHSFSSNDS